MKITIETLDLEKAVLVIYDPENLFTSTIFGGLGPTRRVYQSIEQVLEYVFNRLAFQVFDHEIGTDLVIKLVTSKGVDVIDVVEKETKLK